MLQRISSQVNSLRGLERGEYQSASADFVVLTMDKGLCLRNKRWGIVRLFSIALCALTVYVAFLMVLPHQWAGNENTDYILIYEPVAHNIAAGRGCVNSDGSFATRYPPGYSLILAALFSIAGHNKSLEALLLYTLTGFVVICSSLLVFAVARVAFASNISSVAALLGATYPFFLWLTKQPNSEIPFFMFFLPAVLLFLRGMLSDHPRYLLAFTVGAFLGIASLTRPITVALSIVLILGIWLFGPKWARQRKAFLLFSCIILLGNLLVVLPWEVLAGEKTGHLILLSTGGPLGIVDGLTFAVSPANGHTHVSTELRDFMEATAAQKEQLQSMGAIARYLSQQFVSRPSALIRLITIKMARSWYANDRQSLESWILMLQAPYLVLSCLGVYIAFRMGALQRRFTGLILMVVGYFWLMTITSLSILRYMVPAIMLMMPFVALSLSSLTTMLLSSRMKLMADQPSVSRT